MFTVCAAFLNKVRRQYLELGSVSVFFVIDRLDIDTTYMLRLECCFLFFSLLALYVRPD